MTESNHFSEFSNIATINTATTVRQANWLNFPTTKINIRVQFDDADVVFGTEVAFLAGAVVGGGVHVLFVDGIVEIRVQLDARDESFLSEVGRVVEKVIGSTWVLGSQVLSVTSVTDTKEGFRATITLQRTAANTRGDNVSIVDQRTMAVVVLLGNLEKNNPWEFVVLDFASSDNTKRLWEWSNVTSAVVVPEPALTTVVTTVENVDWGVW